MELKQALQNIKQFTGKIAAEEVLCIRENKDAAIPDLLECVCAAIKFFDEESDSDFDDPTYALFLLAEFRVHEAFEPFIKMLELEAEQCDWLLGDIITEDMPSLLASLADLNDVDRIKSVVENVEIDEFQRIAALSALVTMYAEGVYRRDDLIAYLGYLLNTFENDLGFVTLVVSLCEDVSASEYYERIGDLFENNKLDPLMFGNKFRIEDLPVISVEETLENLGRDYHTRIITDTLETMSCWACFREKPGKTKKIGRNDPCPCGSGKKYKKCCLQMVNDFKMLSTDIEKKDLLE